MGSCTISLTFWVGGVVFLKIGWCLRFQCDVRDELCFSYYAFLQFKDIYFILVGWQFWCLRLS